MSNPTDALWEGIAWTCVAINLILCPVHVYNGYLFYLKRSTAFFQSRIPLATVILVFYQQIVILTKSTNVLFTLSYLPQTWVVADLRAMIEMMPVYSLFFYKFSTLQ